MKPRRTAPLLVLLLAATWNPRPSLGAANSLPRRPVARAPGADADFNGDGIRDLATGVPGEDLGTIVDAGALSVIYGSPTGLTSAGNQLLKQGRGGVPETAEAGDVFGSAVATGDFDGDGFLDVAVGAPGEDLGAAADAGAVVVLYGSTGGITSARSQLWTEGDLPGSGGPGDGFGAQLRTGDLNGDLHDDLVIGAPGEDGGASVDAGAVFVMYGSAGGLTATGGQRWDEDSPGIPDVAEAGDGFGSALAAGQSFDLAGYDDLAVGVPRKAVGGSEDAGAVIVLFGGAGGITSTASQEWSEASAGVIGEPEAGDGFGSALTASGFDGSGGNDLAIAAPGEDVGGIVDAGEIHLLFGGTAGLSSDGNEVWNQDTPGVAGVGEPGDRFGESLRSQDLNGDGIAEVIVGAPAEDVGSWVDAGAVFVLYGSPGGPTATGSQVWTQQTAGVTGEAESGDSFGASLRLGDYDGDGFPDLAIGVPGEDLGTVPDAGVVSLLFGTSTGLSSRDQLWSQDSSGIVDRAEAGDAFGSWIA